MFGCEEMMSCVDLQLALEAEGSINVRTMIHSLRR